MIGIKVCMVNRIEKYAIAIAMLPVNHSFIECLKFVGSFRFHIWSWYLNLDQVFNLFILQGLEYCTWLVFDVSLSVILSI